MKIAAFRTSRRAYEWLRCFNWMPGWQALGHEVRYSTEAVPDTYPADYFDLELDKLGKWCDLLFTSVESLVPHIAEKMLKLRDTHGFKLVCDNDDPLSIVPGQSQPEVAALLRGADLVTFISPVLAADYSHMTRKHIIQPTCVRAKSLELPALETPIDGKKVNLVFMGWPYHVDDLRLIQRDIEQLLATGKFRLISVCVYDKWMDKYPPDSLVHVPYIRLWEKLIGFLKGIPNAIALVPIRAHCEATKYNNNAKFLDYTVAGLPMIVSDVFNSAFLTDGDEVIKVKEGGSWSTAISHLAQNMVMRKRLKKHSRERLLREFTVEQQSERFLADILSALGLSGTAQAAQ